MPAKNREGVLCGIGIWVLVLDFAGLQILLGVAVRLGRGLETTNVSSGKEINPRFVRKASPS